MNICVVSHLCWIRGPIAALPLWNVVCLEVSYEDLTTRAGVLAF